MSLRAVLRKELHEQVLRSGRVTASFWALIAIDVLYNVGLPLLVLSLLGRDGRGAAAGILAGGIGVVAYTSLLLPISSAVDAVAGERERHTLETLLASPASDAAILGGKALAILAAVALHAGLFLVLNLAMGIILFGLGPLLANTLLALAGFAAALLLAAYTTGLGLLISRHAPTVKQGAQWLSYSMMPFFLLPSLGGFAFSALMRQGALQAEARLVLTILAAAAALFLALGALWWTLAFRGFRRERLMAK